MQSEFASLSADWFRASIEGRYSYNFEWLGRPIIQYPQDIQAIQELIWRIKPTLVIETGIAHGGSLVLSASMLALLDMCEAIEAGTMLDPAKSKRRVVGIDVDIRPHNRRALDEHPMRSRMHLIEGSSIDPDVIAQVQGIAAEHERVLVFLDSMHTHAHVLAELEAYAHLVHVGSYCVVFDTVVERLPAGLYADRPWDVGDNPMTAARAFVADHPEFEVDLGIDEKLAISVAPEGFLKRLR